MKLTECKVQDGWICFKCESIQDALKVRNQFKEGDYELAPTKKKRSRNANNYAWELITQIATKLGVSPISIYKDEIRDVSPKVRFLYVKAGEEDTEEKLWTYGHIGRRFDIISCDGEWSYCMETYGSSDFDTSQMAKLIDNILQDCEALEIPTREQEYIDSLLRSWNE